MSEPLAADTVMVGTGSVDLWLRSTAPDVDLEVTISEVRPDGKETYVQSGWLRASYRALDAEKSTELQPVPTYTKDDAAALPASEFSLVRVPLFPFGHAFRAGSRVRIVVQPPGGNRPSWAFDALTYDRSGSRTGSGSAASTRRRWCCPSCPASTCRRRCPRVAACGANRAATTWRPPTERSDEHQV